MTDRYDLLAAIAESELAALRDNDLDEVLSLQSRRATLIAALPDRPPAHARPALERAAAAQRATVARLAAERADVAAELEQLARGRRAATAYGAAARERHGLDRPA